MDSNGYNIENIETDRKCKLRGGNLKKNFKNVRDQKHCKKNKNYFDELSRIDTVEEKNLWGKDTLIKLSKTGKQRGQIL